MAINNPRIVIWCGHAANQKALANKIAEQFNVIGIIADNFITKKKKRSWFDIPSKIIDRLRFGRIYNAWSNLMRDYDRKFPEWPAVPVKHVPGINDQETKRISEEWKPDLIIVSGTALIRQPLIGIPTTIGILNLHTGLSPYVKGGPNCTNWCIANNAFHLIGNTIMWLNEGIDTGNILTTEAINIIPCNDLDQAHKMVMEHAHELYLKAIRYIVNNQPPYPSVPQDKIGKGNLYLTKMWTAEKRNQLLNYWNKRKSFTAPFAPETIVLPA